MAPSKRVRILTAEDVADHKSAGSCWVSLRGKVYDVAGFIPDHPGGEDLILKQAGTDVENIMKDKESHNHSESAYNMLEEYVIGRLGTESTTVSDGALEFLCLASSLPDTKQTGRLRTTLNRKTRTLLKTLQRHSSSICASPCSSKCGRQTSGACINEPFHGI